MPFYDYSFFIIISSITIIELMVTVDNQLTTRLTKLKVEKEKKKRRREQRKSEVV